MIKRLLSNPIFRMGAELRLGANTKLKKEELVPVMSKFEKRLSGTTLPRRAGTVANWIEWMFSVQGTEYGVE